MAPMLNMVAAVVAMEITLAVLSLEQAAVGAAQRAVHGADMQSVVVVRQEQAVAQETQEIPGSTVAAMEEAAVREHPLVVLEVQEVRLAVVAVQAEVLIILATVAGLVAQGH
jgi:hypothetical protein